MQYLNDEQHYIDLYDLLTIKECLRTIDIHQGSLAKKAKTKTKAYDKHKKVYETVLNLDLYFTKGEEYRRKRETIRGWIEKDKEKQDFYDKTNPPSNINCLNCGEELSSDFKHLEDYDGKPMRVLFFFPCKTCKEKRAFYNDGQERIHEPPRCTKCNEIVVEKHTAKGKVITWKRNCPSCGFKEVEVDDFEKSHKEFEDNQKKDMKLLEKYRSEFCLSEKEGNRYISYTTQLKTMMDLIEESETKQKDPAYQKAKNLKKLSVVELENLLIKILEKDKYIKLTFDKPEMNQYVVVHFTVQDADTSRKEYDSTHTLQKIIKKALEATNWRLMSEGVSYRLGYVYGRLKGYEREDDLANLMRVKSSKNDPIMVDEKGPIY